MKTIQIELEDGQVACVLTLGRKLNPLELCVSIELPNERCHVESSDGSYQTESETKRGAMRKALDDRLTKPAKVVGRPFKFRNNTSLRLTQTVSDCIDELAKTMEVDRSTVVSYLVLKAVNAINTNRE